MKVFCCGCEKVRQSDGTWKTETIDKKKDSSTFCPECQRINEQAMLSYQKEKNKKSLVKKAVKILEEAAITVLETDY